MTLNTYQLHERFLIAVKNTRDYWYNEKEFYKIVKKMKKGKNLKGKEFAKVHAVLREAGHRF